MSINDPPRLLVLGATSGIAEAVIRLCAARRWRLHLVARNTVRLAVVAKDAEVRGAKVSSDPIDLGRLEAHRGIVARAWVALGGAPEYVLIAVGSMPDESGLGDHPGIIGEIVEANLTVPASLVESLLIPLAGVEATSIGVLASVAGDRPRGRMAVYGGAKAGIAGYLIGVRHRLAGRGPRIVIIKPGPVETQMTAGTTTLRPPLPSEVAGRLVVRAIETRSGVVYLPGPLRFAMLAVRSLPEFLFWRIRN